MAFLQAQLKNGASPTGSGPLWFTQLWLRSYFPSLGAPSISCPSASCYGLAMEPLTPVSMSKRDIFLFFYSLNSISSFFPFPPFLTPNYVHPPSTLDSASTSLLIWIQFLTGRELFHDILIGTNAKAGVEIYVPQFFARQLGFGQTWPVPLCYSKNLNDRFHTINKVEAEAINVRNLHLSSHFSLAPFNPCHATHPLFEQLWPSVKRRLFATEANRAFHSLDQPSISSPPPVLASPLSIRNPSPSRRTKQSARPSSSLPAKPTMAKSVPSRKRPASASPILEDDVDDDDDDIPLIVKRKVFKLVYLQVCSSPSENFFVY
ncbi:uncharacterized protein LOC111395811 [Olea europaea var. sylvestris]|uniref:uncharacterized protein LOC111395811 n=1 Tax=Olea europaea var. sylvestris TaxID=158386 RepID=UPI000C1D2BD6|nr:uncharacterized protein LOC111395811 [Olea europaea var. sylvestris]